MKDQKNPYSFRLLKALEQKGQNITIEGLSGPGVAVVLAVLKRHIKGKLLVITSTADEAERFHTDQSFFLRDKPVYLYPTREILPYEELKTDPILTSQRINTLHSLLYKEDTIVIASVRALMDRVMPRYALSKSVGFYGVGEEILREDIIRQLIECGYKSVPLVEETGEFSVRGSILDLFPPGFENGCRIEFFGDVIESIRRFDPQTQISFEEMEELIILPVKEVVLNKDRSKRMLQRLEKISSLSWVSQSHLNMIKERIERFETFPGIEFYMPYAYQHLDTIFSYLSHNALICSVEPEAIISEARDYEDEIRERFHKTKMRNLPYPSPEEIFLLSEAFQETMVIYKRIYFSALRGMKSDRKNTLVFPYKQQDTSLMLLKEKSDMQKKGIFENLIKRIRVWQREGKRVVITCLNRAQSDRLVRMLDEYDTGAQVFDSFPLEYLEEKADGIAPVSICLGDISKGVFLDFIELVLITDEEIFGEKIRVPVLKIKRRSAPISSFNNLAVDDYVVHVEHGIALYKGLIKLEIDGIIKDFLLLTFRDGDKLYCPPEGLDLIQKYLGSGDSNPELDKLGGTHWAKVKTKVKKEIEEMAVDLLRLYAEREMSKGISFMKDINWQTEFEAAFEYEETPDQLRAIDEVKKDMESKRPMDRLVCGDVGYGKTEVAMRAAFKAVMSGKQVAMLAPTTVLVQQHLQKFLSRMSPYPIRVEMLSRFVDRKKQKEILKGLETGEVDIVIGTHRLLQRDIFFHDIGLMIIDEEHRFGVRHKERLKELKKEIDSLALTATPIPRTLHMSMVGIRDMSVIDTPPIDRLPIITYITHFDPEIILEACQRELDRGGQIYYVYNRVEGIHEVAGFVQKLLPHARVVVGHGQMPEKELEKVMLDFVHKRYDILVCTIIIESGLDIPSVNTIIINDADRFGLAQLYQLRGRVGRSKHRAYAYLLISSGSVLSEDSRKRLMAIQEFADLGSGFRLATRDLEIRGSGNLLGSKQHGHINAIGFDLYCDFIKETMAELKGESIEQVKKVDIDLNIDTFIPDEYIPDINQKLNVYKRASMIHDFEGIDAARQELKDRYGPIPLTAENLLQLIEIKILCQQLGIQRLRRNQESLFIGFYPDIPLDIEAIITMIENDKGKYRLTPPDTLEVKIPEKESGAIINSIKEILGLLMNMKQ